MKRVRELALAAAVLAGAYGCAALSPGAVIQHAPQLRQPDYEAARIERARQCGASFRSHIDYESNNYQAIQILRANVWAAERVRFVTTRTDDVGRMTNAFAIYCLADGGDHLDWVHVGVWRPHLQTWEWSESEPPTRVIAPGRRKPTARAR